MSKFILNKRSLNDDQGRYRRKTLEKKTTALFINERQFTNPEHNEFTCQINHVQQKRLFN